MKEGFNFTENRFFVEHPNTKIKYSYNHGILAQDPEKACTNFANALNRIPEIIEGYEHKNSDLIKPLPVLQEMAGKEWTKEAELRQLKAGMARLEATISTKLDTAEAQTYEDTSMPAKIGKVVLSVEQRKKLAKGDAIIITGLIDKSGKKHTSNIRWNCQNNKIEFINIKPIKQNKPNHNVKHKV